MYDSPASMEKRMNDYFAQCDAFKTSKVDYDGRVTTFSNPAPYTFSGMAYHLGFSNAESLSDYEKRPEFSEIISRARLKIEAWWESRLAANSNNGAIFWLKNRPKAPWREKLEGEESEVTTLGQLLDRLNAKHASQKLTAIDCVAEDQDGEHR